ncbi:MAG: GspE/PulE family protein [Dehalococcoidia bacterium]|nr:GspE/PulE family protein [Dehalococcoidia bacterium]
MPASASLAGVRGAWPRALVEAGILSLEQLRQARETANRERMPLSRVLVRDGLVGSKTLATIMAIHTGLLMVDLRSESIEPEALKLLPEEMARRYMVLPIRLEAGRLVLAMSDPTDYASLQDVEAFANMPVEAIIATPEDILDHISVSYRLTENQEMDAPGGQGDHGGKVTARVLREAPPAKVFELLLKQAIQDRASDIHIEPSESRLRIRFRIDGILHDVMSLPMEMHPILVSRLKIISGMNIAERRRPQDGQFTTEVQDRRIDIRVAVSNTVNGEMAVLRLLDKRFTLLGLDHIGMNPGVLERFRKLCRLSYGMIIVCGPTGAGKSTTLYASILEMNRVEQNVVSLEDPVEYHIADANQMQVHGEAGITFATLLRSTLRLDPDIVLVGEIRDQETAVIANQAALTGHLVLTSLHANDAVSALLRLKDLGVAPYLIASSVAGILSQRMVRMVCSGCRTIADRPPPEQRAYAEELGENRSQFAFGTGCNMCAQTGYRGRTGVFELLTLSDQIRQLFLSDAPRAKLLEQALAEGMVPLRRDAMLKVKEGDTTPYEVMRVLFTLQ